MLVRRLAVAFALSPLGKPFLARAAAGYSGAELAALCREAGLQAIRRGLARGLAAHQLVVSGSDLHRALASLRAKMNRAESQAANGIVSSVPFGLAVLLSAVSMKLPPGVSANSIKIYICAYHAVNSPGT
jgi:hypothetical protein